MRLLDSNILIYASQPGHEFLLPLIVSAESRVSAISIAEVLGFAGLSAEDEALFDDWFKRLIVQEATLPIMRRAAVLRRERKLKLGDSIIAASALVLDAELVTRNTVDFRDVSGLRVFNPFEQAN